jgi:predicted amino acid racemase
LARPYLQIDLDKIEHNARTIAGLCGRHGIAVTGVTKGTCGAPEVARAMLRGGVSSLGDSRLENLVRLREAGIEAPLMLLRVPPLSRVDEVVEAAELSLHSELRVLAALSEAAARRGRVHPVIVMVDLGDLREGVWPDELIPFASETAALPAVRLVGLGANLACYGGVIPTAENMGRLVALADAVEAQLGLRLAWLSAGNSSALPLLAAGGMPARVNHLRIGEAILLGRETVYHTPWPGTVQDAFLLHAEVIELKRKPSVPLGERGEDAFGRVREFVERGELTRALLDVGREDVDVEALTPTDARLGVLGASSDYLIVDVGAAAGEIRVGDELVFSLGYAALLAAMDSAYVEKRFRGGPQPS